MTDQRRRTVLFGLGTWCLSAGAGAGGLLTGAGAASAQDRLVPAAAVPPMPRLTRPHGMINLSRVETVQNAVALTFDDGPHPQHTPRLLDILAQHRVQATFFVIGAQVRRYPDIVRRMVAEGHELGNHTWHHPFLTRYGDGGVLSEIDRTQEVIWQTVRQVPVTFRPPYGALSARQSRMLHAERNLPSVNWSVDPQDWRRPGAAVVAQRMVEGARPGAIILAHDIHGATVSAVPEAISGLQARGFDCVTLSELLGWGHWGPALARAERFARPLPGPGFSG